jgi:hypothetical protein
LIARADSHPIPQCSHPQRKAFQDQVSLFRREIKFARYSGCFECGMPQQVCQKWERVARGFARRPGGECQFGSLLMEAGAGLLWEMSRGRLVPLQEKGPSRGRQVQYLGEKVGWYGLESNRLVEECHLFYSSLLSSRCI